MSKRNGPQVTLEAAPKNMARTATLDLRIAGVPDRLADAPPYDISDLPLRWAARIAVHPLSGCWIWTGAPDRDGYGRIRGRGAHRVVWEHLVGPVPGGLVLDHRHEERGCLTRACCFPRHLQPVTPRENTLRGIGPSAVNARKDECDHGHPFDERNTYRHRSRRDCRICGRGRVRRYKARQQETAGQQDYRRAA